MANKDYSIRQLLTTEACTNCCLCAEVCPAVSATRDAHLSGVFRLGELKKIIRGRAGLFRILFRKKGISQEQLQQFSDTVFRCTLCGNCQEVCPVGINLKDLWLSLRQDLVHSGAYPKKIDMIRENLTETHNVFAEDNQERADWVDNMREPPPLIKNQAAVVYFTGCVAAYYPMAQKIPMALADIFTAARVDFTLLGEEEWCCGFPLLGAGLKELAQEIIDHNIEAVRSRGAETVVFACPSCYQMWRKHYPHEFEMLHVTEFLLSLIKGQRLPLRDLPLTVTYHDPCDLGRGARVFGPPRAIIRSIPGMHLVELERNRQHCRCCGGGGNLEMIDAELAANIAEEKVDEITATGVDAVVTACQQCVRTINTCVKRNKISLEVMDITQLLERALRT